MRVALLAAVLALLATSGARRLRVLNGDARPTFYLGIAAPPSAAAAVGAFNRTLAELSHKFLAGNYLRNVSLLPLYIELPEDER
ncbi:unnamed protein product [Pieris brassicae]|uniref:Uncharacterized protein n=1 Tax=Pieris brassicae TaxID=7116 RepID=A0A9P0SBG2_PIEBR|nr:unnamed protein product [Pieris brassicae]